MYVIYKIVDGRIKYLLLQDDIFVDSIYNATKYTNSNMASYYLAYTREHHGDTGYALLEVPDIIFMGIKDNIIDRLPTAEELNYVYN